MATQEKLMKSLETLKQLIASNQAPDGQSRKKEKIQHCNFIAEAMLNPTIKIAKNFNQLLSYTMDVLLQLCDDQESDVRMTADECLNRIIRAMSNGSITKIQIELHKEIKHNGPARSLRAALWRFAMLAHHIRPHKGKPYVLNLMPSIVKIMERNEELIHEALANTLPKIMTALGCFTMDNDIKSLLKACVNNVQNTSAVIRRTTASCILTICMNCRKPYIFITYVLNNLLDCLLPVQDSHSSCLISGVLGCVKALLPYVQSSEDKMKTQTSFGGRKDTGENRLSPDRFLQIYEICLYYSTSRDHNIVNASLETLYVLLQHSTQELRNILLSPKGVQKSRIVALESYSKMKLRSPSQLSVATTLISEDNFLLDTDLSDTVRSDIEKWIDESKLSVININYVRSNEEQLNLVDTTDTNARNMLDVDKSCNYSNISIGTIQDQYAESLKSESIAEQIDKLVLSENSSEQSYSQKLDDKSLNTLDEELCMDVDVGDYLDKNVPLQYCARHIAKQFLLSGISKSIIPEKAVRVSTKNLALNCLSSIIQIYPNVLLMYLDKNCAKGNADAKEELSRQQISDVLLFESHSDPQLRGALRILISSFIKSVLIEGFGDYDSWVSKNICVDDSTDFGIKYLIGLLLKGLQDESSTCSRQSLSSLNTCLPLLLESEHSVEALAILNFLPILAKDPYWLVKVKLVDVVSDLKFITIHHVFGNEDFQNKVIHNVLFDLLKDEDQRVRSASSNAIIKIIPFLYFEQQYPNETAVTCKSIHYRNQYLPSMSRNEIDANINKKQFLENTPFPFSSAKCERSKVIESSLSRVISKLYKNFVTTTSKYYILGCIETFCNLCTSYPTSVYSTAWNCLSNVEAKGDVSIFQRSTSIPAATPSQDVILSSSGDLLNVAVNLLIYGVVGYDLNCHINLLKLSGNIFAGKCLENLRPQTDAPSKLWDLLGDKKLAELSESFLVHVVKMLNIFSHILDEVLPALPQTKQVLPNLPSSSNLSPIKRKKSDVGEKRILSPGKIADKDDKGEKKSDVKVNAMGYFANVPHYMKLYDIIKVAHNNYKITLDSDASENFLNLLRVTLHSLSQILEVASLTEIGRIADEVLLYLRSTFSLESTYTVQCVQQLLKSLFKTNVSADIEDVRKYLETGVQWRQNVDSYHGFYYNIVQIPCFDISSCIDSLNKSAKVDCDGDSIMMGYLHRKENKKGPSKSMDKILANYIRIFEPMVIKSLKQYTITSDVKLQCQVLGLLNQLVQLRVNYCLLDSEQIFIGFVLKQFEFIEEGQIALSEELIPKIFQFLVQLSYGKQHSKSIIVIPKIIQLCDGLMASGQSPTTHCIPALKPIVEDVFLVRNKSNTPDFKELETTREVVVSMLLRLLEYHEVIDLVVLILNESKYYDNTERWPRWSKQVFDVFLPLLKHNKVHLDNQGSINSVRRMIFALHPSVFRATNEILLVLFGEPPNKEDLLINRYISKVVILLLSLMQIKEDKLLIKIIENQSDFAPQCIFQNLNQIPDPLNVTKTIDIFDKISPEVVFLRFIFRVVDVTVGKCVAAAIQGDNDFLIQQFNVFLLHCLYIFQSGNHNKIASIAVSLVNGEIEFDENDRLPFSTINENFIRLSFFYPLLTFQWCYILTILNYNNRKFWSTIMQITDSYGIGSQIRKDPVIQKNHSINLEIVRNGGSIVFCDFLSDNLISDGEQMSWLLVNNIEFIVNYHEESPVFDLLNSVHRNSAASGLVLQAIATKCLDNFIPNFRMNILKCVENVHSSQTGTLLMILIPKFLNTRQLAVARTAANLASRKIEYLLTLGMDEVVKQLPKDDLIKIMEMLISLKLAKKHETLVGLLNKLASQFYDLSPLDFDPRRSINPEYIKKLQIDKTWYLSQVKARCHSVRVGAEGPQLLSKLSYDDLTAAMSHKDFNKGILCDCIKWCISRNGDNCAEEEVTLLRACRTVLMKDVINVRSIIPKPHQVFNPEGREVTSSEYRYNLRMCEILSDDFFWSYLQDLIPSIAEYVKSISTFPDLKISESHYEDFVKLAVLCLESITFNLHVNKSNFNLAFVNTCLNCSDVIFKENYLCSILALDTHVTWLCSAVNSLYRLVSCLLINSEPLPNTSIKSLSNTLNDIETRPAGQAVYQLSVLVCWLEKFRHSSVDIPKCLLQNIRSIVISLGRLPLVNSYILTPPTSWKSGWNPTLSGPFHTQIPPLPIEYLQDIEILEEFIFRITLLGWSSRQQFEETWMCLLSVLSASPTENSLPDEINAITHSASLAVQAITSLLLQTLNLPQPGNKNVSTLIHIPRDKALKNDTTSVKCLRRLHKNLAQSMKEHSRTLGYNERLANVFNKPNLEKETADYSYGQLSVEYMLLSARITEVVDENTTSAKLYNKREKILAGIGLDLNSCLQFLLDLYSQWIKSEEPIQLRLLQEVMKSILTISDIFSEKLQFQWMLDVCMELSKTHMAEDEIIHQYLVLGICKASAVLSPGMETFEFAKKIVVQSLKSVFLTARISGVHGLLYILQACILNNTIIGGVSEEMQLFLPVAIEYVQCHITSNNSVLNQSREHTLLVWALAFYVIENVDAPHVELEFVKSVVNAVLVILSDNKLSTSIHIPLIKGIERLLIQQRLPSKTNERIMKFALERLRSVNPTIALPAMQLLYTSIYIEYSEQLENIEVTEGVVQTNPEHLVQTIEKISTVFDRIKRGYPIEVDIMCSSLSDVLNDFFPPSSILTKVISEYLSPQQRHPMQLSKVVFQIFKKTIQQSQLSLLQDWVVFSLTNFTQSFSIGMATWCLTCFFISASTNEWLRNMFPYVQKRIGRYDYEDRKILCIAGANFYNNLDGELQKKTFVETLLKVKDQVDMPFNELLSCL